MTTGVELERERHTVLFVGPYLDPFGSVPDQFQTVPGAALRAQTNGAQKSKPFY